MAYDYAVIADILGIVVHRMDCPYVEEASSGGLPLMRMYDCELPMTPRSVDNFNGVMHSCLEEDDAAV